MRGLLAIAGLMLGLAACTVVPAPAEPPEPAPGTEAPAPPPAAGVAGAAVDPCGDLEALRQFGRLLDASPEEQRREHLLAQQAFAGDPRESNRRRLILTHALARSAWRDDARVQRLLESGEPAGRDAPCA
ncbi:MAG TPA: hypothetical protein PK359_10450, partial [Burkholderiaceae bacterium]|nr:hypothetical protein [Burkholderiaceae bacterium]